jgi:hypothetical protein
METVKVDIQKLQLLNDRIAQTIDALNQLRLSVHGIHHTPAGYPTYGQSQMTPFVQSSPFGGAVPFTQGQPFGQSSPYAQYGAQFSPFANPYTAYSQPYPVGFQHTPNAVSPWSVGNWILPFGTAGNGLSHTTWEPTWQGQTWQTPTTWNQPWQSRTWNGAWDGAWQTRTPWTTTPTW